jgi:ribosomal protein S18 acetylase RimI-like enzyme
MSVKTFIVRPLDASDQEWVKSFLEQHAHSLIVVSRENVYDASQLAGFAAMRGETPIGLLTYHLQDEQCEVVTLHCAIEGVGAGSALMKAAQEWAKAAGAKRLWLLTTNDNLHALKFYQKRGLLLRALYPNGMDKVRKVKPDVPLIGMDGIPLRDMLELDITLP